MRKAPVPAIVLPFSGLVFLGSAVLAEVEAPDRAVGERSSFDAPADEPETDERTPSYAIECEAPCIQFEGDFEIENDWTRFGEPEASTSNDFYPSVEADLKIRPLDWLLFSGHVVTESVLDLEPGESRFLADVGIYAEELNVQFIFGDTELILGKFHPAFGLAWELPPGLYSTDLAGEYELSERIGIGAAHRFTAFGMEHHAQIGAFTIDRTVLSGSLFADRGRVTLDEGGAGNTDGLSSLAVALDGCSGAIPKDCVESGDWGYHVGLLYQRAGAPVIDDDGERIARGDERGVVAALFQSFGLAEDMRLTLFGEAAFLFNFEATHDDASFFTATGILEQGQFTYSFTYSHETRWADRSPDVAADLIDVSIDYELGKRFSLAGEQWKLGPGYAFIRDDGQESHWLGVHLEAEITRTWPNDTDEEDGDSQ